MFLKTKTSKWRTEKSHFSNETNSLLFVANYFIFISVYILSWNAVFKSMSLLMIFYSPVSSSLKLWSETLLVFIAHSWFDFSLDCFPLKIPEKLWILLRHCSCSTRVVNISPAKNKLSFVDSQWIKTKIFSFYLCLYNKTFYWRKEMY